MDSIINAGKEFLQKQAGGNNVALEDDLHNAHNEAANHAGSSGNAELFSNVMSVINQKKGDLANNQNIDEQDAINKHKDAYNNDSGNHDANSLGTAAAMQALKMFNQGGTQKQSQGAFLGLAMSEASKLFDAKAANGQVSSGADKQTAIQKAGEMAMKMYFKSQADSQGGLAGMASKFLN